MPHLVSGLLIAAILAAAMSNLSAALNSLSSTTIVDFYARLRPASSEQRRMQLSRMAMVFWALVLFALALVARHGGRVIEVGLSIASVTYGALLGAFLLGVLTRTATERGAMVGMICGLALNLYLWLFTSISFTWYVVLGSIVTFTVGSLAYRQTPAWHPEPSCKGTEMQNCELTTERRNRATEHLDSMSAIELVTVMNHEDARVPGAVRRALPEIALAVDLIAEHFAKGGRLIYVGTGTSGRIGALDASECTPTFGTPPEMVQFLIAGGEPALVHATEASEDDAELGRATWLE